jgi:hypothetical protein
MSPAPIHPVDELSAAEKCRIYYSRVVDLAVAQGLLDPDPDTEIGHFAFSRYYFEGKELDSGLRGRIKSFEADHPETAKARRKELNERLLGAVEDFRKSDDQEKIKFLIIVGASYCVWPTGTSFTLEYPWTLDGTGRAVRFRKDLSDFTKRRIMTILKKSGKFRNPNIFTS